MDWGDRTLSEELPIFEDVVIPKTELYMRKRIDDRIDIAIEVGQEDLLCWGGGPKARLFQCFSAIAFSCSASP